MPATVQQNKGNAPPAQGQAPTVLVPFTRAAKEHMETFYDKTVTLSASPSSLGPIDVPAYGFARGVWILCEATGGSGTAAVAAAADGPFSLFDTITLSDVNGAPIYGPLSGYETSIVDKLGGYFPGLPDPKSDPDYSPIAVGANASGNFTFLLYVPLEISGRDALGALGNMNGASTYKINLGVTALSNLYTTAPTNPPTVRIRMMLDAWSQPTAADLEGNPQAVEPPAHGTTQYWTKQVFNLSASGYQTLRLAKVGNLIRSHVYIWRNAAGARVSATFPDPFETYLDSTLLKSLTPKLLRTRTAQKYGFSGVDGAAGALDVGVYVEDYMHDFDGKAGWELRDGWLQTSQSTRFDVTGTFGEAGTLTVLTNDVSPVGNVYL